VANKVIKDPVHGYISLLPMFSKIVDTSEFQRLKWIEQGSFRVLYPAARHDRFIHSLGTYHLATKISDNFINNIEEDLSIKTRPEDKELICTTFYYASLLHDIGHAPFSHTTENLFKHKLREKDIKIDGIEIKEKLVDEIACISSKDATQTFINEFKNTKASPHEIISATILVENANNFLKEEDKEKIDLELAVRMVIGCTYTYFKNASLSQEERDLLGIKNCFIRLLNSTTVDVDKLDYISRDTQMSGFFNVPIDIERLTKSVTAIRENNGYIYPAFRKNALSVIDNVFRAKSEQGLWMVSHPIVAYDSELREECIKRLSNHIHCNYITNVFSLEALSKSGITFDNKKYRLLNDVDISSDLRRFYEEDELIQELYQRDIRRKPVWKSYYEYKYLFNTQNKDEFIGTEEVFTYFKPLIDYLKNSELFVFNKKTYNMIFEQGKATEEVKRGAEFLKNFSEDNDIPLDFVIIFTSNTFGAKFDPKRVFIHFNNLPARSNDNKNYVSYDFLKESGIKSESIRFFYLFVKEKLSAIQVEKFRAAIINELANLQEIDRA
jgi:HD superfamily phosphohydrolase